ncbi:hypothetical protein MASR1M31_04470 [Porphyromonadaceae bacterium]
MLPSLFKYFAKFIPKDVLTKSFIQPKSSLIPQYNEISSYVLSLPDDDVINDLTWFVLSANERMVSERVRNNNGYTLFVEYGKITIDSESLSSTHQHVAITVAHPLSDSNKDNLSEILILDRCLSILQSILFTMHKNQEELEFCPSKTLIDYPVTVTPIDPSSFYGCGGFVAAMLRITTHC